MSGGAPPPPGTGSPNPVARFFGGLIMAVGALMTVLCGLCTVVFGFSAVTSSPGPENFIDLPVVGMVGGIPTAIGVGIFFLGRMVFRMKSSGR